MINHSRNITRIKSVFSALAHLSTNSIFVGGAVVSLYADRPYDDARPTEDIVFVLNNRQTVWQDFDSAPIRVIKYLQSQFAKLLDHSNIKELISANLNYDEQ